MLEETESFTWEVIEGYTPKPSEDQLFLSGRTDVDKGIQLFREAKQRKLLAKFGIELHEPKSKQ